MTSRATIAGKLLGKFNRANDKPSAEQKLIDSAVECIKWGHDYLRYEYSDGSRLLYNFLLDDWHK